MAGGLAIALTSVSSAFAAETVTYTYDARGRLVKVEHSGAVNNNVKTEYSHDKADHRANVKITGVAGDPAVAAGIHNQDSPAVGTPVGVLLQFTQILEQTRPVPVPTDPRPPRGLGLAERV
ncbi:hypothetical protein KY084_12325 [Stakelama sp. CBK3Z-3]|uniref:RHS repeat protein n=1 Tax=Stakelama flava TaxID=2860338 RepID=A0ABS6XND1_9SPHN|nr:hypothetical protein [Stakelama flava]MBW4331656.1 hypothetical protein [Stakelama flava]